jgi:LysR family carnitine catabolism transcriptional activator
MGITLDQLQAFVAIARLGSFTRAARTLHLSQPAVSTQIRNLEDVLGARLFDRNTRSVAVSPVGKELAPVLERILHDIEAVAVGVKERAATPQGVVTVGALPSISSGLLPIAIARFQARFPAASVRLKDAVAGRVVAMVKAGEVDFGIASSIRADPEIQIAPLMTDRMNVVFRPGHPLESKRVITVPDLRGYPLILTDPQSSVRTLVDRAFESNGDLPSPAYEVTYMSTAIGLAKAGLGIAILPSSAAFEGKQLSMLRWRPIRHQALTRKIGLIRRTGRSLSAAAQRFAEVLAAAASSFRP